MKDTDTAPVRPAKAGRPGLTKSEVTQAFDALVDAGLTEPSLGQLRERLGHRGSNSTISRYRAEIRAERLLNTGKPADQSAESLLWPVINDVMSRISQEAAVAADTQVAEARKAFDTAQHQLRAERDAAEQVAHDATVQLSEKDARIVDFTTQVQSISLALDKERVSRMGAEEEQKALHESALTQAKETGALMSDLGSLTDDYNELSQQSQQQTATLESERLSWEAQRHHLQQTIDSLSEQIRVSDAKQIHHDEQHRDAIKRRETMLSDQQHIISDLRQQLKSETQLHRKALEKSEKQRTLEMEKRSHTEGTLTMALSSIRDKEVMIEQLIARLPPPGKR